MPVVPKRRDELVDQRPSRMAGVSSGRWLEPSVPSPPRGWHKTARAVWDSFAESGQIDYWQSTDWAVAFSICEDLSAYKQAEALTARVVAEQRKWDRDAAHLSKDERVEAGFSAGRPTVPRGGSPQKMAEVYRVLGDLMVTESDRRRVRVELDASTGEVEVDPAADVMQKYLDGLRGDGV